MSLILSAIPYVIVSIVSILLYVFISKEISKRKAMRLSNWNDQRIKKQSELWDLAWEKYPIDTSLSAKEYGKLFDINHDLQSELIINGLSEWGKKHPKP